MKNARPGFVIDPYRFDGSFLTSMSDGIHCDYTHKTLEELRAGEDNPRLVTVSRNTADKMFRIHLKSKCLPFKEITESQYYENMDMLPPVRHTRNFFFIGEPCFRDLYTFCFHVEGRYFTGLRSVTTPRKELEKQMEGHYRSLTFRGGVTKGPACAITGKTNRQYLLTPYFFTDTDGEKKFICNLVTGPDEEPDIRNARKNMAEILLSLRRHHFLYFSAHKRRDENITLVSGNESMVFSSEKNIINGSATNIKLEATKEYDLNTQTGTMKGTNLTVEGTANMTVTGGIVKINS